MYAEVLVEYGAKALDRTFTYIIPETLKPLLQVGMKVVVPFGNTTINGFVIKITDTTSAGNLKEIKSITNPDLILNKELLDLGFYVKDKTLCSLIQAYQTMLPSSMKVKTIKVNYQRYNEYLEIYNQNSVMKYLQNHKQAKKQIELLNKLINKEEVLKQDYNNEIVNKLLDLDLIKIRKEIKYRIDKNQISSQNLSLTDEQQSAVDTIKESLGSSKTFLIHGVTGSGKTEVYMNLIAEVIKNNKTAIMLVPEISLTAQIVDRFYARFGSEVAIFHSALSDGEKYDEYHKIMRKEVKVVVGTRSAIFVPLKNIGLIVIDEEQSSNYKQDNNPRYNAIDVALKRSETHSCPVILGSATPSLESMARGIKGVYTLIKLTKRIGVSVLPNISLVDMTPEYRKRNMIISDLLDSKIKEKLSKQEQIMLLLNRRGYTTIMSCKNCGNTFKCPHCDITLTYHKTTNNLRCHYCGYTLMNPEVCPECHEKSLTSYGLGTEKLEEEISKKYPEARVIRMDADTTTRKGSGEEIIKKIENLEADIIIGTQMISKGFDFPKITLVGVINADESLNIPDFRSGERTFELLSQTSGRAGRSELKGEVIIQTFNPENQTLAFVKQNNYELFYNYEMNVRRMLKYPPYYYLTIIKIASKDYNMASDESRKVLTFLNRNLKDIIILGPTTASMFKYNNVYRFQIILKYRNYELIKNTLIDLDDNYKINNKVNIEIDNNPCRL